MCFHYFSYGIIICIIGMVQGFIKGFSNSKKTVILDGLLGALDGMLGAFFINIYGCCWLLGLTKLKENNSTKKHEPWFLEKALVVIKIIEVVSVFIVSIFMTTNLASLTSPTIFCNIFYIFLNQKW